MIINSRNIVNPNKIYPVILFYVFLAWFVCY